jgi:polar amino acid transport system substrate-binding protein
MSLTSILHKLGEEIHLVVALIALSAFAVWEVWAHLGKHERISYRAYLWVILMFLLATNLSMFKLLHGGMLPSKTPDALEQIASTGKIRIGISHVAWGPFLCLDEEKVELTGFDIEVAKQVVNSISDEVQRRWGKTNIKPNFILFPWKPLFEAVKENDVDFAISAITRDKDRERDYQLIFSNPYYKTHPSYAMFRNSDENSMHAGRKAIYIAGTTSFKVVKGAVGDSKVQPEDNWLLAFKSFRQSAVEHPFIFDDYAFMRYRLTRMNLMKEVVIKELESREEEYGIAVNEKQRNLLRLINESLMELKEKGILSELQNTWLVDDVPKQCLKEVG